MLRVSAEKNSSVPHPLSVMEQRVVTVIFNHIVEVDKTDET